MDVIAVDWSLSGLSGTDSLSSAVAALPLSACVTIMVHGYRFSPADPNRSPHAHILSRTPRRGCWKATSWPRRLHLDRGTTRLGIAFGWPAIGRLGPVAARAFAAAAGLAGLLARITTARPDIHISLFAHSLGARVALEALRLSPAHTIHRAILLSGAEYRPLARAALASPAGHTAQIVNVRSSENLPFDLAFRACVPAPHFAALPLSAGLRGAPNWIDLSIDCPAARAGLKALGHRIATPSTRFCHWSGYLRPGLFPLYRRLLDPTETRLIAALRTLDTGRTPEQRPTGGVGGQLSPL